MQKNRVHQCAVVISTFLVLALALTGIIAAVRSPLFVVQVVEIDAAQTFNQEVPVDFQVVTQLAAVPVGKVSLFQLNLSEIEKRILTNVWIRSVQIVKRFPQTVAISLSFREPRALLQNHDGSLSYVDSDGVIFGRVNLSIQPDLPLIQGLNGTRHKQVTEALELIRRWDELTLKKGIQLTGLSWDEDRGFRLQVIYGSLGTSETAAFNARTMIEWGTQPMISFEEKTDRLFKVFSYLVEHRVMAKSIFADSDKKIIVKVARGS